MLKEVPEEKNKREKGGRRGREREWRREGDRGKREREKRRCKPV